MKKEERVLETCVYAQIGGDRSKEKPNLKIISGLAEINRANIVRVCEKEEKREREREREREGAEKFKKRD